MPHHRTIWGIRTKANYGARAGETIAGNLKRGGDGKFSSAGGASGGPAQRGVQLSKQPTPTTHAAPSGGKGGKGKGGKKGGGTKGGAGAKPRKEQLTPEQRQAQHAAEQAQNRADVLGKLNIAPDGQQALAALRSGEQPDADAIARGGFVQAGLVERAQDGSFRLTSSGRALLAAVDAGDAGRAGDTISSARDRTTARTDRQSAAAARHAATEQKRAAAEQQRLEAAKKPKAGGGGSSKQPADDAPSAADRAAHRARTAADTAGTVGLAPSDLSDMQQAADAGGVKNQDMIDRGLLGADGMTTDAGRRALAALERGDVRGYRAAVQDAQAKQERARVAESRRIETERNRLARAQQPKRWGTRTKAQTASDRAMFAKMGSGGGGGGGGSGGGTSGGAAWKKGADGKRVPPYQSTIRKGQAALGGKNDWPLREALGQAQGAHDRIHIIKHSLAKGTGLGGHALGPLDRKNIETQLRQQQRREDSALRTIHDHTRQATAKKTKAAAFVVYKDAAGTPRWLARTTTAYRDRDGEILATAALDADSQRMTATRQFGPLRYWHVGTPDPADPARPWGPGLDLGMCDFSVVIGRTRVESGTFKSAQVAAAVAAVAAQHEMSPGFFHPEHHPGPDNVFTQMRTFERSLVPTHYARASNLFTGFTVKEHRMDPEEMQRRFKAAIAELGLDAAQAELLGQQLVQTEKAAQTQGIAFKSSDAPAVYTAPDGTPGIIQDGHFVALKAAGPPPPEEDAAAIELQAADDALDADMEPDGDEVVDADVVGNMAPAAFAGLIGQAVAEAIAPLVKAIDIAGKMDGQVNELKSMFTTKEEQSSAATEIANLKAQQQQLTAQLAALEGDAPAVGLSPDAEAALKSAGPQTPAQLDGDAAPPPGISKEMWDMAARAVQGGGSPNTAFHQMLQRQLPQG